MDTDELEKLKKSLLKPPKNKRKLVLVCFFSGLLIIGVFVIGYRTSPQETFPCYISKAQKDALKQHITLIASSGKISEYMMFRRLKRKFQYETIGKMPCNQFKSAIAFLTDFEKEQH